MGVERVLFVTNMFPRPERPSFGIIVARMADALRGRGVDVVVEQIRGDTDRRDYFRAGRRVRRSLRAFRPDVVHVHFGWSFLAANFVGVPRVVTFYGDDLHGTVREGRGESVISRSGRAISQLAALRCERSIAVSDSLRARICFGAARGRCTVIRDAVDERLFSPGRRDVMRAALGVPAEELRVLFPHSLLQATKRVDLARDAIAALAARGVPASLWVVNDARPDEMPAYYRAADALIVTSDREGGPSCVKEAMACGLPVVSVPVGDIETLARAGDRAFITERDPAALAAALQSAFAAGSGPRASYLPPELTLSEASRKVLDVYESAIGDRFNA